MQAQPALAGFTLLGHCFSCGYKEKFDFKYAPTTQPIQIGWIHHERDSRDSVEINKP